MNSNRNYKGDIRVNLKIEDFPLTNYYLQVIQQEVNFADKVYILIDLNGKTFTGLKYNNINDTQIALKLDNISEGNISNNISLNNQNDIKKKNSTNIITNNNVNNNNVNKMKYQ